MSQDILPGKQILVGDETYLVQQITGSFVWLKSQTSLYPVLLVLFPNGYYLYRTDGIPQQVQVPPIELTGVENLDVQILLEFSDEDLKTFCLVAPSLCQNQTLWQEKISKKFGPEYLQFSEASQKYYQDLRTLFYYMNQDQRDLERYLDEEASQGNLGLLKAAALSQFYPSPEVLQKYSISL